MRKIHVARQFFEASGREVNFFRKNSFLDKANGSMCAKFQVCIFLAWPGGVTQTNTYTNTHINK